MVGASGKFSSVSGGGQCQAAVVACARVLAVAIKWGQPMLGSGSSEGDDKRSWARQWRWRL